MRWLLAFGLWLCLCACRKEPSAYDAALEQHRALVLRGERPDSKAFDEVLTLLGTVPADSPNAAEAQKLAAAITRARAPVRRPLATVHANEADLAEPIRAQTRACAVLAEQLARDGGATPAVVRALDDCRRRIERLERDFHDAHEPPGDDVSQRLEQLLDAGALGR